MKKLISTIILLLLTSQSHAEVWSFEKDKIGSKPRGFYFDEVHKRPESKWRVALDGKNHVLTQIDNTRVKKRYAVGVVKDSDFKNVKVEVKIKISPSKKSRPTGGVVWRYRDSENYLIARIDFFAKEVLLYRIVNGNAVRFGTERNIKLKDNSWNKLRVEHKGDRIKVYVNDEAHIVEKDKHYRKSGKVGLFTDSDAGAYFDDFVVKEI